MTTDEIFEWLGRNWFPIFWWALFIVPVLGLAALVGTVLTPWAGGIVIGVALTYLGTWETCYQRLLERSPLARQLAYGGQAAPEAALGMEWAARLGLTEDGQEVFVNPRNKGGMVVSGLPGCGKTAAVRQLVTQWATRGAQGCVIDFKGVKDFDLLGKVGWPVVGDDLEAAVKALKDFKEVHFDARRERMKQAAVSNFWELPDGERGPLAVLVIDECQELFDTTGGDPKRKQLALEATGIVQTLLKRGRSVGVFVVLATQKADNSAIPTRIRDQAALRIAGAVKTRETARAAVGEIREGEPTPLDLPPGVAGRLIFVNDWGQSVVVQADYYSLNYLEGVLAAMAEAA